MFAVVSCTQQGTPLEITQPKESERMKEKTEATTQERAVPVTEPVTEPAQDTTEATDTVKEVKALLKPIPVFPVYIHEHYGALRGVPANAKGQSDFVLIDFALSDGTEVSRTDIDFFTLDGALYITHKHTKQVDGEMVEALDYYKQTGNDIELLDSIPAKPAEKRATLDGTKWLIETSVISGVEYSYLYSRDTEVIQSQGSAGGKGAFIARHLTLTGYAEIDAGLLIATGDSTLLIQQGRTCQIPVAEQSRIWK
jgi:hypothetical protein